ncbi:hypothetical protein HHK36_014573 [Tetracentron sinense]|uniref:Transmembrane protein n=1 Tax=Tetracentron sinense TaxID=13715 RepID=A0A835DD15_TETSI|nr:hypothetical protein HHK36_014573 [Tetracentron sinense]
MAQTHKTKPKTKRSCFTSCFRLSPGIPGPDGENPSKYIRSGCRRKIRCFSWSRFPINKSGTKTVPVDAPISDKTNHHEEIETVDSGKITEKRQIPVVKEKPPKAKHKTLETHKPLDDTCHKQIALDRKKESKMSSPENKPKSSKRAMTSQSPASPPAPNGPKPVVHLSGRSRRLVGKKSGRENDTFDPIVGMSILIVTLGIMLLWGKLCAIVCSSAWFYFMGRLVNFKEIADNRSASTDSGLNSESYKKKVILEGLLERNHRKPMGFL